MKDNGLHPERIVVTNSFNMYKLISRADSAITLLSTLAERIMPVKVSKERAKDIDKETDGIFNDYLHYFDTYHFLTF